MQWSCWKIIHIEKLPSGASWTSSTLALGKTRGDCYELPSSSAEDDENEGEGEEGGGAEDVKTAAQEFINHAAIEAAT